MYMRHDITRPDHIAPREDTAQRGTHRLPADAEQGDRQPGKAEDMIALLAERMHRKEPRR